MKSLTSVLFQLALIAVAYQSTAVAGLAQVKSLFLCPHGVDTSLFTCRTCNPQSKEDRERFELDPKLKDAPDFSALQAKLEALRAAAANPTTVSTRVALATRSAELTIRDAAAAYSRGKVDQVVQLANEARKGLVPILQSEGVNYSPAWLAAGKVALLIHDDRLAAAAMVNVERLEPNYSNNAAVLDLMAELNRRPLDRFLAEARANPSGILNSPSWKPLIEVGFVNSLGMRFVPVPGMV